MDNAPHPLAPQGRPALPRLQTHPAHSPASPPPHRPTTRPTQRLGGSSEAELLGVHSRQSQPRRHGACSAKLASPSQASHSSFFDDHDDHQTPRSYRPSLRQTESTALKGLDGYLDSLDRNELAVVETRFDLMTDEEIRLYLQNQEDAPDESEPPVDVSDSAPEFGQLPSQEKPDLFGAQSPLFPPSPPPVRARALAHDHPLRILSRVVKELKEVIDRLEDENDSLREAQSRRRSSSSKAADQISIHDNLNEAIATSLTSTSSLRHIPEQSISNTKSLPSTIAPSPSTSSRRRPLSPASGLSVPAPSASSDGLEEEDKDISGTTSRENQKSWTSGLWVWSNKKSIKSRKGSISSFASSYPTSSDFGAPAQANAAAGNNDDDEIWRKGDGNNTPSFTAIFLATRILTPDPSSILVSTKIPANSLVAYLAHSLVNTARDEGIAIKEPVGRRRSRDASRSQTISTASHVPVPVNGTDPTGDGRQNGDGALAVTASLGRSLLSSVAGATMRGSKNMVGSGSDEPRPSLRSRGSSSRGHPSAVASPAVVQHATMDSPPSAETPLPSVELSSIVPDESRPPTVLLSRENIGSFFQANKMAKQKIATASRFKSEEPPLTDRYGFIYDIQHAKMLKEASAAGAPAPMSLNGTIPKADQEEEGWIAKQRRGSHGSHKSARSILSHEEGHSSQLASPRPSAHSTLPGVQSSTPDRSTPADSRSRSSTLANHSRHRSGTLNLNPSPARPVTGKDQLTVSARGSSSLRSNVSPVAPSSAGAPPLSASLSQPIGNDELASASASRVTVSSLLDRLTELHDRQQKERVAEWDAFLKKRNKRRTGDKDQRWTAGLNGVGQMGLSNQGQEDFRSFARLVRKGLPLKYRGDIWAGKLVAFSTAHVANLTAECSGAKDLMVPGEYSEILTVHKDFESPVLADIEKDVSRTFPGNVFFGGDGPGVGKLRRVLVAYSWYNSAVGYCQGMNMLAATLLLTLTDEEQAFWALVCMIDKALPSNYFSSSLIGSRADQLVLSQIVAQILPKIHNHFQQLGVDLASITFGWFLSLFTDCLPVETLFRVWDIFFVEGHDSIFRVAVAILKLNEVEICACESVGDLFTIISSMTSRLWAADKLIALQNSYKTVIKHVDLVARCEKAVEALENGEV
ncbi:hypothetical protein L198_04086 [Cryptococcus wingfieldii CBS 7118]|uniref:Rab-GAP TBC domain-containing protein n=1 Tax=Cryptococcus wingfieldii CBS 7118 TaxID=1295528 RepID=A0A1E3J6A6_9TREE|nr:hypothetical protein L198_04086 [Cryptococcus wingfieldii CBS 7118]ODN96372.1 hypothetical protein L198_04086 [Cryptococcus wingfieldii CBS 7118]